MSSILRKCETLHTPEDKKLLQSCSKQVKEIHERRKRLQKYKERVLEVEDPPDVIEKKAKKLADAIYRARHLVCYTGAGISTSARIPDYRGSQGIWTLLEKGEEIGKHDLSLAEPTYTHMALYELHRRSLLRYVVSQNCDGLHLRSGLPKKSLSEVHGNMYTEACKHCKPNAVYWRLFDTTELTARHYHKTNRRCHECGKPLIDTIVHFGERGSLQFPLNWKGACAHSDETDVILCLGSSLKVLKKYAWLWATDRPKKKRPQLIIVNLQWTPKDTQASLKINGKCDDVMELVMKYLNINVPLYIREKDPIFHHASLLCNEELHTVSQPMVKTHNEMKIKDENTEENEINENMENGNLQPKEICTNKENENPFRNKNNLALESSKKDENDETQNIPNENEISSITTENSQLNTETDISQQNETDINLMNQKSSNSINNSSNCVDESDKVPELLENLQSNCDNKMKEESFNHENNGKLKKTSSLLRLFRRDKVLETNSKDLMICDEQIEIAKQNYYKQLLEYYKAIEDSLPHWYDVNYAYSGLHSIIHPPPPEIDLWSKNSIIIPIVKLKTENQTECEFCFDNYGEFYCQFYRPRKPEFKVKTFRNDKEIVCECCDYSDDDEDDDEGESTTTTDDGERAKLLDKDDQSSDSVLKEPIKIVQPGWYGKGCRKNFRKKKKSKE